MDNRKVNYYEPCDKAIRLMNRFNLEAFGRMKLAKWDEVNIIRTVISTYNESIEYARRRYLEVAIGAYIMAMEMCGVRKTEAEWRSKGAITAEWINRILVDVDFITLYRFDTEAERKAYKLAETLEVTPEKAKEIDKALRYWSQQLGQYAINVTDYAVIQAFEDCGIQYVMWVSEKDGRTCGKCITYDENIYKVKEVPVKPHWGCRCRLVPVKDPAK